MQSLSPTPRTHSTNILTTHSHFVHRYTLLLSSKAAAKCDGAYNMMTARITDSIRTHVGMQSCAPYPTWPSQDTAADGAGLAHVLAESCDGAAEKKVAKCTGSADPCTGKAACTEDSAITCVPKACVGKFLLHNALTGVDACQPVFISKVTGLPVQSCQITVQRLARQARQAEKRLTATTAAGAAAPDANTTAADEGGDAAGQAPTRLGSVLGGGSRLVPLPQLGTGKDSSTQP